MEGQRLLDVPITAAEHQRRDSDHELLLNSDETNRNFHDRATSPTIERFRSLRTSAHRISNPDYVPRSPVIHQRIPSNFDDGPQKVVDLNQSTSYDREATHPRLDYPPELWKPFWIRKTTMGVLLLLFLVIITGSILLWYYSHQLNGFDFNSSTSYYAWTYAPVAFMVIILSVWRQVDYYFKLLAPWNELRKGPVSATESLLVDYVSPTHIVSLFAAFKRGCIPVILSIIVFVCLKIITIFSAALLVPLPTVIISNSSFATSTELFDASSLVLSATSNISSFTSDPVYTTIGNVAYNLPYAPGVTSKYAYLPVTLKADAGSDLGNATYTTHTDVLFPTLSCEPLTVILSSNSNIQANRTTVNMTSNFISLRLPNGNVCNKWVNPTVYAMNPQRERTPPRQLQGTMQRVYCVADEQDDSQPLEPVGLLFTVTDIRYAQDVLRNGTIWHSRRNVTAMSNILCVPGYYIINANINNSSAIYGSNGAGIQILNVKNQTLDGLSRRNLAVIYEGIMNASAGIFGTREDNPRAFSVPNTVFNLMALMANKTNLEPFLDPKSMQTVAETAFRQVMSNYAAQRLTKPAQTNVTAQAVYTKQKLHINSIPFYIVLVTGAMAALCTALLFVITPGPLVPKDPSFIATSAAILVRSPELNRVLRRQISSKTAMAVAMSEFEFGSAIATNELGQSSFKIVVTAAASKPILPMERRTGQWWSPNTLLLPALCVAAIVPLVLIGVLEYLQNRSDSNQGLQNLTIDPSTAVYIHCIPVLVMLLISAAVEVLNFHVALFSPWNKLQRGNASANSGLFGHLLGKIPPVAYVKAVRGGHIGAISSISAAILASVLLIVGAGLYSVQNVTVVGFPQTLAASGTLLTRNNYSVLDDRGAAGILRLIDQQNSAYPAGTFEDLVFPSYSARSNDEPVSPLNATVGPLTATVPAIRANLRCDIVPSSNIDIQYTSASRTWNFDHYRVDSTYNLPESCRTSIASYRRNLSDIKFQNRFRVNNEESVLYGGQLLDLIFGQNASLVGYHGETRAATTGNSPAVGCPSLAFTFADIRNDTQTFQVSSFVCYQEVQQVQANVTFSPNSTELDPSHTPEVIESSVSLMTNPDSRNNVKSFDWRIQLNIERQLFGLNGSRLQSGDPATTFRFDAFFSYLINSTSNKDPAVFAGPSNQESLITAINNLYRRYMAQAINGNMRGPLTTTPISARKRQSFPSSSVNLQTNVLQPVLIQDKTSKLILQVLFGLVAMFSIIAYALTNFHRLLPCNPCSIAGTMSLLAGSDLCLPTEDALCDCCGKPRRTSWGHDHSDDTEESIHANPSEYQTSATNIPRLQYIPVGAEWADASRFAAFFAGHRYSLGWWREDRRKGRRRRFGVDVGRRPDGEYDDDWELGDRRPLGDHGFEGFVMKGREMLGGSRGRYQQASDGGDAPMPRTSLRPARAPTPELQQEYHEHEQPYAHGGLQEPIHDEPDRPPTPELQQHYYERGYAHGGLQDPEQQRPEHGSASPPVIPPMSPRRVRFHDHI